MRMEKVNLPVNIRTETCVHFLLLFYCLRTGVFGTVYFDVHGFQIDKTNIQGENKMITFMI